MSLPQRAFTVWRTFGTGIFFLIFGLAGLLIGGVLVPVVRLLAPSQDAAERRIQRILQLSFRGYLSFVAPLGLGKIRWEGEERLRTPGTLVVANHPTLIDVVVLMAAMPQCYCIVKEASFRNPFLRGAARAAGYISNADGVTMVDKCAELLRGGRSLLLFPEGTRSGPHELGGFKRGWAHIALRTGCDPVPVVISCEPPTLMKGQKWYEIPERPFELTIRVGEPLALQSVVRAGESRGRAVRALNSALREHFEKGLARADVG